mmetsp:Transcript_22921/g.71898  ORF Transcript_22921/g.71898 Transcript_22921/m.71898 type:complete len:242 (-) Transcript_22921:695-1420(-)
MKVASRSWSWWASEAWTNWATASKVSPEMAASSQRWALWEGPRRRGTGRAPRKRRYLGCFPGSGGSGRDQVPGAGAKLGSMVPSASQGTQPKSARRTKVAPATSSRRRTSQTSPGLRRWPVMGASGAAWVRTSTKGTSSTTRTKSWSAGTAAGASSSGGASFRREMMWALMAAIHSAMSRSSGATRNQEALPVVTQKQFSVSVKEVMEAGSRRMTLSAAAFLAALSTPRAWAWAFFSKYSR